MRTKTWAGHRRVGVDRPVSRRAARPQAHRTVDARLPQRSQQATLRTLVDEALRKLVDKFVTAWEQAASARWSPCSPTTPP
jgi:hypothetical protein